MKKIRGEDILEQEEAKRQITEEDKLFVTPAGYTVRRGLRVAHAARNADEDHGVERCRTRAQRDLRGTTRARVAQNE